MNQTQDRLGKLLEEMKASGCYREEVVTDLRSRIADLPDPCRVRRDQYAVRAEELLQGSGLTPTDIETLVYAIRDNRTVEEQERLKKAVFDDALKNVQENE